MLVIYEAEFYSFPPKFQHGLDEVISDRRKQPAGTQDQVSPQSVPQSQFTFSLASTLNPKRYYRVRFQVGTLLAAIEYVIARHMQHGNVSFLVGMGELTHQVTIDCKCSLPLVFRSINLSIGSIDRDIGLLAAKALPLCIGPVMSSRCRSNATNVCG